MKILYFISYLVYFLFFLKKRGNLKFTLFLIYRLFIKLLISFNLRLLILTNIFKLNILKTNN